jgi:hypothetical protein
MSLGETLLGETLLGETLLGEPSLGEPLLGEKMWYHTHAYVSPTPHTCIVGMSTFSAKFSLALSHIGISTQIYLGIWFILELLLQPLLIKCHSCLSSVKQTN